MTMRFVGIVIYAVSLAASSWASSEPQLFEIPAGPASETLKLVAQQGQVEILFAASTVTAIRTNAISGKYYINDALDLMLQGTPLKAVQASVSVAYAIVDREGEMTESEGATEIKDHKSMNIENKSGLGVGKLFKITTAAGAIFAGQSEIGAQDGEQKSGEPVFELNPFTVNANEETGYRATSTLAGTRLNTQLRDVGSAISVLTSELFEDTGAVDASTILSYALNMEVGGSQGNFSGTEFSAGRPDTVQSRVNPQGTQRVRGLASASLTRNYFLTDIPFDTYNSDRVTINRGPNSLLFGIGSPGGVIDNSVKSASIGQNFGTASVRVGERDSFRLTLDYNKTVLEDRLAVRFNALYEDQRFKQRPSHEIDKRLYGAFRAVIAENEESDLLGRTTLRGNFEQGSINGIPSSVIPPGDGGISTWFVPPDPDLQQITGTEFPSWVTDGSFVPKFTVDNASGARYTNINGSVLSPYFIHNAIYYSQPDSQVASIGLPNSDLQGIMARMRFNGATSGPNVGRPLMDLFATQHFYANSYTRGFTVPVIMDRNVFDNENHLIGGTTNYLESDFDVNNIVLEQVFMDGSAGLELAFDRQDYQSEYALPFTSGALGGASSNTEVVVDLSETLGNGEPNPNLGRPMMKDTPFGGHSERDSDREAFTVTAFYEADFTNKGENLGWLGRHVLTGFYGKQSIDELNLTYGSGWQSESTDISTNHIGLLNHFRRQVVGIVYVGDSLLGSDVQSFSDVRIADSISVPLAADGDMHEIAYYDSASGLVLTSDDFEVRTFLNDGRIKRQEIETNVVSLQSHLLRDNLVGLVGWREDTSDSFEQIGDSRLPNGVYDPANLQLGDSPAFTGSGDTLTWSLVGHYPDEQLPSLPWGTSLSVHYNESENFSPVGARRNSLGETLPTPEGSTTEYGFSLGLLENRLGVRVNWFETSNSYADAGLGGDVSAATDTVFAWLGRWMAARDEGQTIDEAVEFAGGPDAVGFWNSYDEAFGAFQALLPAEARDVQNFRQEGNSWERDPIFGETATTDFVAEGMEVDVVGNLTKQWRLFLNVGKQETIQTSTALTARAIALEVEQNLEASGFADFRDSPNLGEVETFSQRLARQAFGLSSAAAKDGTVSQEQRKWRANLVTTYDFENGMFKGFSFGTGVRWQDRVATGYRLAIDERGVQVPDVSRPYFGKDQLNGDVWVRYGRKLADFLDWEIQLNVRNAFGDNDPITVITNPDGMVAVVRNPNVREAFLTNTFSF